MPEAIGLLLLALAVSAAIALRMIHRARELQARLEAAEAELAAAKSEPSSAKAELVAAKAECAAAKAELVAAKAECAAAKAELVAAKAECAAAKAEPVAAKAELATAKAELAAAKAELAVTREEFARLKGSTDKRCLHDPAAGISPGSVESSGQTMPSKLRECDDLHSLQQEAQHALALLMWESEGGRVPDCCEVEEGSGETGNGAAEQIRTQPDGGNKDNLGIEPNKHSETSLDHLWLDIGGES